MKYFLLLGGFAGFVVVLVASFYAGNRPATALRDAAVACLVGGMLFRMLHAAYIAGVKGCIADRARGAKEEEEEEEMDNSRRKRV